MSRGDDKPTGRKKGHSRDDEWDPRKPERRFSYTLRNRAYVADKPVVAGRANQRHVVAGPKGGWIVMKPGSERASARTKTQGQAIKRAREILEKSGGGTVLIHRADGRVDKDTIPRAKDTSTPRTKK